MTVITEPRICWCGRQYAPTTDGRTQHRMLQGHTPCDESNRVRTAQAQMVVQGAGLDAQEAH